MSLVSNTGSITISVISGTSALALKAGTMASNSWDTLTINNVLNPDPEGVGDTILSYANTGVWDPTNKVVQFWGGAHGGSTPTSNRMQLATWNDASNTWSSPVGAGGNSIFEHGYYNVGVDRSTGTLYTRLAFGSTNIRPFSQTTRTFGTSFTEPPNGSNYSTPLVYHPDLGLLRGHYWGIYRRVGSSWTQLMGSGATGDRDPVGCYNPRDNCVYLGGGFTDGQGQLDSLRKINSSGTITTVPGPGGWALKTFAAGAANTDACLVGGSSINKMMAISYGGQIREFDNVTDTWSNVITNFPANFNSAGVNPGSSWFAVSVDTYHCVVFFKLASMTAMSTTMHIYKR